MLWPTLWSRGQCRYNIVENLLLWLIIMCVDALQIADGFLQYFGHKDFVTDYASLQFALYMTCFVCVCGGGFFLGCAVHVEHDRQAANLVTQGIKSLTDCDFSVLMRSPSHVLHVKLWHCITDCTDSTNLCYWPLALSDWQWEVMIFDPTESTPLPDCQKICHRLLHQWPLPLYQIWCKSVLCFDLPSVLSHFWFYLPGAGTSG